MMGPSMRLARTACWPWLLAAVVAADAPLPPPAPVVRCSKNGVYCGKADPKADSIVVYRKDAPEKVLWSVAGWQRAFDVSDSGDSLVACYSGMNLLPLDYEPEWTMLSFYERGRLVRKVSLAELVPDRSKLRRTVSHYEWGRCRGFDGPRSYAVETVDRGLLRFDAATGQPAR